MNKDEFKLVILLDRSDAKKGAMFVPVQVEEGLLESLEDVLHPERVSEDCRNLIPQDARALLSHVLGGLHIKWEDIPHPGTSKIQQN